VARLKKHLLKLSTEQTLRSVVLTNS